MPFFGRNSKKHLSTCHLDSQIICNETIKHIDFSVLCGYRSQEDQKKAYEKGLTKVEYPNSKHNQNPSMAFDVAPYPIDWNDTDRFILLAGFIMGITEMLYKDGEISHVLRWGGDWDMDRAIKDHKFKDFGHFELIKR